MATATLSAAAPYYAFTACNIGYNLNDGAMEDALYEIALCCLPGYPWIAPCRTRTTIERFRHLRAASTGPPIVQDHQSLAGEAGRHDDDSRHLGRCHHHWGSQLDQEQKEQQHPIRRCIRPRRAISGTLALKAHGGVDARVKLTHSLVTTAVTGMTSISWVICCMERAICLSRCRQGATARGADRWMWTAGIAERPARSKQHTKEQNVRIHESQHWSTVSHRKATVRLRENQIQRGC